MRIIGNPRRGPRITSHTARLFRKDFEMGIIAWIIIGIIAGWLAEQIMGRNHGLLTNLIVGVIGALIGGFLANSLGFAWGGWIGSTIVATIGAIILLFLLGLVKRRA